MPPHDSGLRIGVGLLLAAYPVLMIASALTHGRWLALAALLSLLTAPLLFDRATAHPAIADNPHLRWCNAADAAALGLPAPVRTLLQDIL